MTPSIGANGELLPFYKFSSSWRFSFTIRYTTNEGQFLSNSARVYVFFFFYICFLLFTN